MQSSGALSVRQRISREPCRNWPPLMWSALSSATSTGSRRTIFCALPVHRLLPPGERPVKPVPPFSGFEQPRDLGGVVVDAGVADEVQQAVLAVKAEQQAVDRARRLVLVVAGEHGVDRVPDLELAHHALAGPVGLVERLGHDAVEPWSARQPPHRRRRRAGRLRQRQDRVLPAAFTKPSSAARRSDSGLPVSLPVASASRSNTISCAGYSSASLATRLAAGCRRSCRVSKPWPGMTISPSRTKRSAFSRPALRRSPGRTG